MARRAPGHLREPRRGIDNLLRLENRAEPWLVVLTDGAVPSIDDRHAHRSAREAAAWGTGSASRTRESLLQTRASLLLTAVMLRT
jgi:hypothetical protein